jgi:hypothetical protein
LELKIEQVDGGYIVTLANGNKLVASSTEDLFKLLLDKFENRRDYGGFNHFGKVEIKRERKQDWD